MEALTDVDPYVIVTIERLRELVQKTREEEVSLTVHGVKYPVTILVPFEFVEELEKVAASDPDRKTPGGRVEIPASWFVGNRVGY